MRKLVLALILAMFPLAITIAPDRSFAQGIVPPIVQSLDESGDEDPEHANYRFVLDVAGGAVGSAFVLNIITGGSLLAPILGAPIATAISGAALGFPALSLAGQQTLYQGMTLLTTMTLGGIATYWIAHP